MATILDACLNSELEWEPETRCCYHIHGAAQKQFTKKIVIHKNIVHSSEHSVEHTLIA